jgi:hypothetical protein
MHEMEFDQAYFQDLTKSSLQKFTMYFYEL